MEIARFQVTGVCLIAEERNVYNVLEIEGHSGLCPKDEVLPENFTVTCSFSRGIANPSLLIKISCFSLALVRDRNFSPSEGPFLDEVGIISNSRFFVLIVTLSTV